MASTAVASGRFAPLARPRHTIILIAIFVVAAVAGALRGSAAASDSARPVGVYVSLIALEWALVWFVARGIRASGAGLRDLIGGRWTSARDVVRDAAAAAALWLVWKGIVTAWEVLAPSPTSHLVQSLLPDGPG